MVGTCLTCGKQLEFGDYKQSMDQKRTKREKFLAEKAQVVARKVLTDVIVPNFPKKINKGERPGYPLATMLSIQQVQQWYSLSDPAMEDALIEVPTMRHFAGIDLISVKNP